MPSAQPLMPILSKPVGLSGLPGLKESGVYFLWLGDEIVYVGQARDIRRRIGQHLTEGRKNFDAVSFALCSPVVLTELERYYIRKHAPRYNACGIGKEARDYKDAGGVYDLGPPPFKPIKKERHRKLRRQASIATHS